MLRKKYLFGKFWTKLLRKHSWWSPVLKNCKACNCTKRGVHRGSFLGNFPKSLGQSFGYLRKAASVISLYLHRCLNIFSVHFHLRFKSSFLLVHGVAIRL